MTIKFIQDSNSWMVSYSKRNPKTGQAISLRRKGVATENEAKKVERQLIAQVEQRIHAQCVPTWESVGNGFLDSCIERGLAQHTIDRYRWILESKTAFLRKRRVDSITTLELRAFVKSEEAKGLSTGYLRNLLQTFRAVFKFAVAERYLVSDPTPHFPFRKGDKLSGCLKKNEVKIFLDAAREIEPDWFPIWAMALFTGLRSGELYALRWQNVDFENRIIKVVESWNSKSGVKSTKSGDERIVPIAQELVHILSSLRLRTGATGFVLPRMWEWTKGRQSTVLRKFLLGIGLPRVRFHDLRATWATLLLCNGIEPAKVMAMGGWKDLKTMQIYIRKAGIDVQGATNCLDFQLSRSISEQKMDFALLA